MRLVSSMGLDRSFTSTCLFSAKEVADLTNPSISAPLKFFVRSVAQRSSCHVSGTKLLCRQCRGTVTASSRRAADVCACRHAKGRKAAQHGLHSTCQITAPNRRGSSKGERALTLDAWQVLLGSHQVAMHSHSMAAVCWLDAVRVPGRCCQTVGDQSAQGLTCQGPKVHVPRQERIGLHLACVDLQHSHQQLGGSAHPASFVCSCGTGWSWTKAAASGVWCACATPLPARRP